MILFHVSRSLRLTCSPVCDKPLTPSHPTHASTQRHTHRSLVSQTHIPQAHRSISTLPRVAGVSQTETQAHTHTEVPRGLDAQPQKHNSLTHTKASHPRRKQAAQGMLVALLRHAQLKDTQRSTDTDTPRRTHHPRDSPVGRPGPTATHTETKAQIQTETKTGGDTQPAALTQAQACTPGPRQRQIHAQRFRCGHM